MATGDFYGVKMTSSTAVGPGSLMFYNGSGIHSTNLLTNAALRLYPILDEMMEKYGYKLRVETSYVEDCIMLAIDGAEKAFPLASRHAVEDSKYDDLWFSRMPASIEYYIEMHRTRP